MSIGAETLTGDYISQILEVMTFTESDQEEGWSTKAGDLMGRRKLAFSKRSLAASAIFDAWRQSTLIK